MDVSAIERPERPHKFASTASLKTGLANASRDARRYAQTGPKQWEDIQHLIANEFLDELQRRGEL
jgi:hypothetical protein